MEKTNIQAQESESGELAWKVSMKKSSRILNLKIIEKELIQFYTFNNLEARDLIRQI